jgi:hypothetical protein
MTKSALEALRIGSVALVAGLLCMPSGWAQTDGTRGLLRVPVSTAFEPRLMPFQGNSAFAGYETLGSTPWISLQFVNRPNEKVFVHLKTLRWATSMPNAVAPAQKSAVPRQDNVQRAYSAQDVRALWTNRGVLTAWLDFDNASDALRQRLKESGGLQATARVQTLTTETYSEISTAPTTAGKIVLKRVSGQIITPEAPAPTWVEPLFHQVFIACVAAEPPAKLPLSKEVLGNRYETDKRCGLMSDEGRWLARPEFEFMEGVHGDGPFLLMLRGLEPCISTMHMPVRVTCLGQPLSSLFTSGKLPFSRANPQSPRRGGDAIGYVATDGTWSIVPKFREARAFSGKIAAVHSAGTPGVIDSVGNWLTPAVPSDPVAARWLVQRRMSQLSGEGLINRAGQMVIPFLFPKVEALGETSYRVCHQDGCDTVQVPKAPAAPKVKPIAANVSAQAAQIAARWVPAGENDQWGYQEANGRWILKPRFEEAEPFEDGLAKAKSEGMWGIILPTGKWLHRPQFQSISPFFYGVAVAQDANGNQYLLRADGKQIDITRGRVFSEFGADGLAVAGDPRGDAMGHIDRSAEWLTQPVYSQVQPFSGGYAIVSGKLPEGWRPANFTEPPYLLRSLHWLSADVIVLRALIGEEERVGLMDKEGNWLVPAP